MAKFYLTKKAVDDLTEIWEYTYGEWSERQANNYYNILLESCQEIADKPNLGKQYDIITKSLLGFKSNHHIIFFRIISPKKIEILRILHERMDLKSRV